MITENNVYAVVLAGGSGTRFWPKSRHLRPKQLCTIGNNQDTMIETTLKRLDGFIPQERRLIVTHQEQLPLTKKIVGPLCNWYLGEPEAKNTAAALALAALEIEKQHKSDLPPIMVSLHADHIIEDTESFYNAINAAVKLATENQLALLGITPTYPETGYGYIESGKKHESIEGTFHVKSFREKPDFLTAKQYLETGKFSWNAGIFVWKTEVLINELKERLTNTITPLEKLIENCENHSFTTATIQELANTYSQLPKISIDHAVLETSNKVAVVPADLGWQDVGSWSAVELCSELDEDGNSLKGDVIAIDSSKITVDTDGPLIACVGLKDLVVVASGGAILVCPKERAQDVRKVVEKLKETSRNDFL